MEHEKDVNEVLTGCLFIAIVIVAILISGLLFLSKILV